MALFQPIAPASYPKGTAQEAALLKAKYDAEAKARSDSLRSNNIKGASDIYNKSMGDRTPINDWLTKQFGGAPPSNLPGQTTAGKSGFTSGSGVGGNDMVYDPYGGGGPNPSNAYGGGNSSFDPAYYGTPNSPSTGATASPMDMSISPEPTSFGPGSVDPIAEQSMFSDMAAEEAARGAAVDASATDVLGNSMGFGNAGSGVGTSSTAAAADAALIGEGVGGTAALTAEAAAAELAAAELAAGTAGTAVAGSAAPLAGMGPAGWAALAAMLLLG